MEVSIDNQKENEKNNNTFNQDESIIKNSTGND